MFLKCVQNSGGGESGNHNVYVFGREYEEYTGGFAFEKYAPSSSYSGKFPTLTRNADFFNLRMDTNSTGGLMRTANKLDVSDKDLLLINIKGAGAILYCKLGLMGDNQQMLLEVSPQVGLNAIDISSFSGIYYPYIRIWRYHDDPNIDVNLITLL